MKVLTIKEPWASLIINGYKVYEFRNFKTNYRGKILIHAGLTLEKNNAVKFNDYNLDYGHGEIIGEAYITDCILVDEEFEDKLYNINPLVYGKTNEVHPLVVILSVFAGGILFGIAGIVISLPLAIIIITTFKFFREDISYKIEDIKGSTKKIGRKKTIKNK